MDVSAFTRGLFANALETVDSVTPATLAMSFMEVGMSFPQTLVDTSACITLYQKWINPSSGEPGLLHLR